MSEVGEGIIFYSGYKENWSRDELEVMKRISVTDIDILDLISEGEIEGLVSGTWNLSGTVGFTGYSSGTFTPYTAPSAGKEFLRSIYWNQVPVINDAGQYNFQSVTVSYTKGLPNGATLSVDAAPFENVNKLSVARGIGERLRATVLKDDGTLLGPDYSKIYRIINKNCIYATVNLRIQALSRTETGGDDAGDVTDSWFDVEFYYRPIYSDNRAMDYRFIEKITLIGKINVGFIYSYNINFANNRAVEEKNFQGWEIKIRRLTPDSTNSYIRNITFIDSIVEYYANNFTYPNSAVVQSKFSAEYFSQIPQRAFEAKLLKVKIPNTYDPILRTYSEGTTGYWDGTFKDQKEWTNNPAWCFYDLVTNKRYGLGRYLSEDIVDKFELYEIAKYCDVLVSDGQGGLEPRFTCNMVLFNREEAYKVLNDMASVFRGLVYYANGTIHAIQDSEKAAVTQFTNANVEEGEFSYFGVSKRNRHTVAIVRYNDPSNFYLPAIEYVEDVDGIRRYGLRELELGAFGCTSKGQAIRLGRWALASEILENESISFNAGLEGVYLRPGDVFKVFDKNRKTKYHAGRTTAIESNVTGHKVTLDRQISLNTGTVYQFSLLTPSFNYNSALVSGYTSADVEHIRKSFLQQMNFTGVYGTGIISGKSIIQFPNYFNTDEYTVTENQIWSLELPSGADITPEQERELISIYSDYYRVINVEEKEGYRYTINGLRYNPQKYIEIESGLSFQRTRPQVQFVPPAPAAIDFSVDDRRFSKVINYWLQVNDYSGVSSFRVYAQRDSGFAGTSPTEAGMIGNLSVDRPRGAFVPAVTGYYYFRAYSYNAESNLYSNGYASGRVLIDGLIDPIQDITISSLVIKDFTGSYTSDPTPSARVTVLDPTFQWQAGTDQLPSAGNNFYYRFTVREPSKSNIPSSNIYYSVTGIVSEGNRLEYSFPFTTNRGLVGGPYRNYDVVVEAMNTGGYTSAGNRVDPITENGWTRNLNGYDIINVFNPPITGIDLSSGDVHPVGYQTEQYWDINRDIYIIITGGVVPTDCLGGYIHSSIIPFSGGDVQTGAAWVKTKKFAWDSRAEFCHTTRQMLNHRVKTGYCAVSFFDEFDDPLISHTNRYWTGLYVSNCVPIINSGEAGILSFLHSNNKHSNVQTQVIDGVERMIIVFDDGSTGIF